jgi:Crp-like helix-turn-helix domain
MTDDRVGSTPFHLTQEFFAQMQGGRRATINRVGRIFQEWWLIRHTRGKMTILDRPGLQAIARKSYAIIRCEYDCLLREHHAVARDRRLSSHSDRLCRAGDPLVNHAPHCRLWCASDDSHVGITDAAVPCRTERNP